MTVIKRPVATCRQGKLLVGKICLCKHLINKVQVQSSDISHMAAIVFELLCQFWNLVDYL